MTTKHTPIFDNYGNVSVGNYVGGLDGLPDAYALQCSITADLLAALEECITDDPGAACFNTGRKTRRLQAITDIARAAIARAKGQA